MNICHQSRRIGRFRSGFTGNRARAVMTVGCNHARFNSLGAICWANKTHFKLQFAIAPDKDKPTCRCALLRAEHWCALRVKGVQLGVAFFVQRVGVGKFTQGIVFLSFILRQIWLLRIKPGEFVLLGPVHIVIKTRLRPFPALIHQPLRHFCQCQRRRKTLPLGRSKN
ncbi:MAG: hypothetical protein ACD_10C00407G0001, partial [uncultured bacterium]